MAINYNGKRFRSVSNTDNGEVNEETIFNYYQEGSIVWADYSGGNIRKGTLIAKVDDDGNLDMRYSHVNIAAEIMTGKCFSKPIVLDNGKVRLYETWEWTSGDHSTGNSIVEEL